MPKQSAEIGKFNSGIILNSSERDIPQDAASFSLNINPMAEDGILDAIYTDREIGTLRANSLADFLTPIDSDQNRFIVKDVRVFNNQSLTTLRITGTKGATEYLEVKNIEPEWDLAKDINGSHLSFIPTLAITSDSTELSMLDTGKASTTISVTDGDAIEGVTNGQYFVIISTDGTSKNYVINDTNTGGQATGVVLASSTVIGSGTGTLNAVTDAGTLPALTEGVSVGIDFSSATRRDVLEQLETAIEHANGHAGKITVTDPGVAANGVQYIKLEQATAGTDGNTSIIHNTNLTISSTFRNLNMITDSKNINFNTAGDWAVYDPSAGSAVSIALVSNKLQVTSTTDSAIEGAKLASAKLTAPINGKKYRISASLSAASGTPLVYGNFGGDVQTDTNNISDVESVYHFDNHANSTTGDLRIFTYIGTAHVITINDVSVKEGIEFSGGIDFESYFDEGDYISFIGHETSGIVINHASGYSITNRATTLTVDTTATTSAHVGRKFVKSDGTFIGTCTAVTPDNALTLDAVYAPLQENEVLYMIKDTLPVNRETFQIMKFDSNNNIFEVKRRCFGSPTQTFSAADKCSIYRNAETVNGIQYKTTKGAGLIEGFDNLFNFNDTNYIRGKSWRENVGVGSALGTGGTDKTLTFDAVAKTMTLTRNDNSLKYTAGNLNKGDIFTFYHSVNDTPNTNVTFKVVATTEVGKLYHIEPFKSTEVITSVAINSGTAYFESDLIGNPLFKHSVDVPSTTEDTGDVGPTNERKVNDWYHWALLSDYNLVDLTHTSTEVASIASGGYAGATVDANYQIEENLLGTDDDKYITIKSTYDDLSTDILLTESIDDITTILKVKGFDASGKIYEIFASYDILKIENEYLRIVKNGIGNSELTVERGIFGSIAASHAADVVIKKNYSHRIAQSLVRELKPGQYYEFSFYAKNEAYKSNLDADTYIPSGYFAITVNGKYFDSTGELVSGPRDGYLNGITGVQAAASNSGPTMEEKWISFESLDLIEPDGGILDTHWKRYSYKFFIQKNLKLINTPLIEISNRGYENSILAIDYVSLDEITYGLPLLSNDTSISASSFIENSGKKDLILYDNSSKVFSVIKDFKSQSNLQSTSTDPIISSSFISGDSNSSNGIIAMINNNREMHVGYGPNAEDSSPQWLGYINHKVFGKDETNELYLDEDTIHSYDGGSTSSAISKIALAGEHECLVANWSSGASTLDITHVDHSMNVGDNIVVREWEDTDNSWGGAGVWVVTSKPDDDSIVCKRFTDLDPNPAGSSFMGSSDLGKVCYRPYFYYGIRDGSYSLYRIWPDTRIADDASGLDSTGDFNKGKIEISPPLSIQATSITTCHNKKTDGTGGGMIYVLDKNTPPHVVALDVQIKYDEWEKAEISTVADLDFAFKSFKWSNDDINGNINGDEAVFDSLAEESTPTIAYSGMPSDIIETKGTLPTYTQKVTVNTTNTPAHYDTRLWLQFQHGPDNTFKEGSRFLFCGITNATNVGTNLNTTIPMGDRTPPTTTVFPASPRYRTGSDHDYSFYGGPGVTSGTLAGDRFGLGLGVTDGVLKNYAYWTVSLEHNPPALRGLTAVRNGSGGTRSWSDHPYRISENGSDKIPYMHFGYNVGWDGKAGFPEIQVVKYGLCPMADNDMDGVIDGTGLVIPSVETLPYTGHKSIKTGPYGHHHQKVCGHAVGLLGGGNTPWVKHWGRLMKFTKSHYEGALGRTDKTSHNMDAPENMKADKVLWICSDIHFGDHAPHHEYTVSTITEQSDWGVSSNDKSILNLSHATTALQAGDTFWITSTGNSNYDDKAGYIISQIDEDSFLCNLDYDNTAIGTCYIYPFSAAGDNFNEQNSRHIENDLTAIAPDYYKGFHWAFDDADKDNGERFTKAEQAAGHFAKTWYTPPFCWGMEGENTQTSWSLCSPGILNKLERLNYRAGCMMRPFSMDDDQFENLVLGNGTFMDISAFPFPVYHTQNASYLHYSVGESGQQNYHASKLIVSSDSGESGFSRQYIADLNLCYIDKSTQIEINARHGGGGKTNTYNDVASWDIIFGGKVTSYTDAATTADYYGDATYHPVVKVQHSSSSECLHNQSIVTQTTYKNTNVYAGACISFMSYSDAAGDTHGAIETRYIISSESDSTYHYLKIHYPFRHKPVDNDRYWVWSHANATTSTIKLNKQHTLSHGLKYANNTDSLSSIEIFRDWDFNISATTTGSASPTTFTTNWKHNYATNDEVIISGTTSYNGTHKISAIVSPIKFSVAIVDSNASETGKVKASNFGSSSIAPSNPYYLDFERPVIKYLFGGLDMRKLRKYTTSGTPDFEANAVAADLTITSTAHKLLAGDTITAVGDRDEHTGVYAIKDVNTNDIDVSNDDTTDDDTASTLYTNQWESFIMSSSGDSKMSEVRFGTTAWDKGNSLHNAIRSDKATTDTLNLYMAQTLSASISIEDASVEDTTGYFQSNINYEYKVSYMYDGYQEGLLSKASWFFLDTKDRNKLRVSLSLGEYSRRLTHICLYRRDNSNDLFKLVKDIDADDKWTFDTIGELYQISILDKGPLGATYEARTGLSEVLDSITVKYDISTQIDGYLFVGNCSHDKIKNASNLIFRSKPGRFSTFDYANDTIQLISTPTAMASFMGRLFVFDNHNIYKINQESLVIEDTFEGVGCLGQKSIVVTEYGMFFADKGGLYKHNGRAPEKVSNTITRGGDISENVSYNIQQMTSKNDKIDTHDIPDISWENTVGNNKEIPSVVFDSNINSILILVNIDDMIVNLNSLQSTVHRLKKVYYIWSYNILKNRWDLWNSEEQTNMGEMFAGIDGKIYLSVNSALLELRGGSNKRQYSWISKKINLSNDSATKVFNKIKINGLGKNLIQSLTSNDSIANRNLFIHTNLGQVPSMDITYSTKSTNNSSYKLSGSNRKGRWVQFRLQKMEDSLESIGILYRMRPVR